MRRIRKFPRRRRKGKNWKLHDLKWREEVRRKNLEDHVKHLKQEVRWLKSYPWSITKLRKLLRLFNECDRGHQMIKDYNRAKGLVKQYKTWQKKRRKKVS